MEKKTFVGLDIHRKSVVATALDQDGRKISTVTLGSSHEELAEYITGLPGEKTVAMEACPMWEHYFDAVKSTGVPTLLSHPYRTRLIAEASLKNDRVDSEALATLLRLNSLPQAYAPDTKTRELRRMIKDWAYYKRHEKSIKMRIYCVLMAKGVAYETGLLQKKGKREDLRALEIPEVNRGLDYLLDLEKIEKEMKRVVHEAFERTPEAQLLATIPGVGEFIGVALAAWLCPIERFRNVRQVISYCGLCPTNHQSGESSYHGHLKEDCNHLLRWLLIECGWKHRSLEKKGWVAKAGRRSARHARRGGGAVTAAQKLLQIIYAVLRRGTPYFHESPGRSSHYARIARPRAGARDELSVGGRPGACGR